MKKFVVVLLLCALTNAVIGQKSYYLGASVGNGDWEMRSHAEAVQDVKNALIKKNIVSSENSWLLTQPTMADFSSGAGVLRNLGGPGDFLYVCIMLHGTGYNVALKMPFYGIKPATDLKHTDAWEDSLQIRANLFGPETDYFYRQYRSLGINKILADFSYYQSAATTVTIFDVRVYLTYDIFKAQCLKLVAAEDLAVNGRCPLKLQYYHLAADSNKDGLMDDLQDRIDCLKRGSQYWTILKSYSRYPLAGDSLLKENFFGANQNVDSDLAQAKDQLFGLLTADGWHLACDLNNADSVNYAKYTPDLIDSDDDGILDCGDVNQDGDLDDGVEFPSAMMFKDGNVNFEKDVIPVLQSFPGTVILIDAACYGGKHISLLPEKMIGYSLSNKFSETNHSDLVQLSQVIERSEISSLLDIFNCTNGWLNDNSDGVITQCPQLNVGVNDDGYQSSLIRFKTNPTTVAKFAKSMPIAMQLFQNHPNPFNPTTTIDYTLTHSGQVKLTVFDVLGHEVTVLVNQRQLAGNHRATFNAENLSAGTYFYRLEAEGSIETKKMVLVK